MKNMTVKQDFINHVKTINLLASGNKYPKYATPPGYAWTYFSINVWVSGIVPALKCWIYKQTKNATDKTNAIAAVTTFYNDDNVNWNDLNQYMALGLIKGVEMVGSSDSHYNDWKTKIFAHANRLTDIQFNSTIGAITNSTTDLYVIIDSMTVSIALLVWAYNNTSDSGLRTKYLNVINRHTNTVIRDHLVGKADAGSSWQRVFYNSDGTVHHKNNFQSQGSTTSNLITWARGQAWGMYGLALVYGITGSSAHLNAFKSLADFWITSLNNATWSDNGVMKNTIGASYASYDTSGTAIATLALFKMANSVDAATKTRYLAAANKSLTKLTSSGYMSGGRLMHGFYVPWDNTLYDLETQWGNYFMSELFDVNVGIDPIIITPPATTDNSTLVIVIMAIVIIAIIYFIWSGISGKMSNSGVGGSSYGGSSNGIAI